MTFKSSGSQLEKNVEQQSVSFNDHHIE